MRKLCLPLTLIAASAAFAIGCEDGPDQTFQPAPPGAAGYWNNGNSDAAAYLGSTSYEAGFPTVNAVTLCSTDFKRERWAWMLTQPIQPPRRYAGIDMAKDDLWDGLTIEEAETPPSNGDPTNPEGGLCQSTPLGFEGICPSGIGQCNGAQWGNAGEVGFSWNTATHILDQMTLNLGYTGPLQTGPYPDHTGAVHSYTITIGDVYRRDGEPFEVNWNSADDRETKVTDMFNAIMSTYAPSAGVPFDQDACTKDTDCVVAGATLVCECTHTIDSTTGKPTVNCASSTPSKCGVANCGTDGNCLLSPNNGGGTYFGIRPMVVYIVGTAGVPQPALSTPTLIYNFLTKFEPYSNIPQTVSLDANGPTAQGTPLGAADAGTVCIQHIGQTFSDLVNNCVAVSGNSTTDTVNVNKIEHGLTHDQEHWTANVLGINQNFTSASVAANPNAVVLDTDTPQPADTTQDYEFDLRARGALSNDGSLQGSALMMIEWARLLTEDIAKQLSAFKGYNVPVKKLGDPSCIGFTGGVPNYATTNAPSQQHAGGTFGCSGIEGLIIPNGAAGSGAPAVPFAGDPNLNIDPNANLNPLTNFDEFGFYASVLHPGDIFGALCIDPSQNMDPLGLPVGFTDCTASTLASNSIWTDMLYQVTRVLGNGDVNLLPPEMQDRRYYFKWFGVAFVRYLMAWGNYVAKCGAAAAPLAPNGSCTGGLGPSDLVNTPVDQEALFFDYNVAPGTGGAQTYDKFEYIDRRNIGSGNGSPNTIPWDFEFGSDLVAGNQRYDNWYRRMDREEIGMYTAMLENKSDTPGKELNVNITNMFGSTVLNGNPAAGVPGAYPSFACATGSAGDPATLGCANTGTFYQYTGGLYAFPGMNPPLNPVQSGADPGCTLASAAAGTATCATAGKVCVAAPSFENGPVAACVTPCDFTGTPNTGCPLVGGVQTQVCALDMGTFSNEGCMDALMDKNVGTALAQPILAHYPGVWGRTPYSMGHSPIKLSPADEHPEIGVAHVHVPIFQTSATCPTCNGPYTVSPQPQSALADGGLGCPDTTWTLQPDGLCQAPTISATPEVDPLTPWLTVQQGVGFSFPLTGVRDQYVSTGQFDYTGVLESYIVDYVPWVDTLQPGCVGSDLDSSTACSPGFTCDPVTKDCVDSDNSVRIEAIEGADFLGQAFLCQDPATGDMLHLGMYDSVLKAVNWLQEHPGNNGPLNVGQAQATCQIILVRTPANNYIDQVVTLSNGVVLNISGGQGLGRVTDIVAFDPSLVQPL